MSNLELKSWDPNYGEKELMFGVNSTAKSFISSISSESSEICTNIFSGLRSLCTMRFLSMKSTVNNSCEAISRISFSETCLSYLIMLPKVPPFKYSSINFTLFCVSYIFRSWTMEPHFLRLLWMRISSTSCSIWQGCFRFYFLIILRA